MRVHIQILVIHSITHSRTFTNTRARTRVFAYTHTLTRIQSYARVFTRRYVFKFVITFMHAKYIRDHCQLRLYILRLICGNPNPYKHRTMTFSVIVYRLEHRFLTANYFLQFLVWAGPGMTVHIQRLVIHAITHTRTFTNARTC